YRCSTPGAGFARASAGGSSETPPRWFSGELPPSSPRRAARPGPPPAPTLDGHVAQEGGPPPGVGPGPRPRPAAHRILRPGPERPRDLQDASPPGGGSKRLDAPVGVGGALDHAVPLEQVDAARQGRLVDGESILELPQVRLAQVGEGREDAELGHPQAARPQD